VEAEMGQVTVRSLEQNLHFMDTKDIFIFAAEKELRSAKKECGKQGSRLARLRKRFRLHNQQLSTPSPEYFIILGNLNAYETTLACMLVTARNRLASITTWREKLQELQ
jgi:hypothetical protein